MTRQTLWTVAIGRATDTRCRSGIERVAFRIWMTGRVGHTDIALRTGTSWLVQNHTTQSVDPTGTAKTARIHALQIYAGFFIGAL